LTAIIHEKMQMLIESPTSDRRARGAKTEQAEREAAFFNRYVAEHGDYDVLGEGAYRRLEQAFVRGVRPLPGERCIDMGCGTGAFLRRLRHLGLSLQGMDISPEAVAFATRNATTERYLCRDITASGLPDASQDIVLYSGVLHHFPTPEDRAVVLREGWRILAPGGRLFAFDPNSHNPPMWLYRHPSSPLFSTKGRTDNEVLLSREQLNRELGAAGFSRREVRGIDGITFRFVDHSLGRWLLPAYNLFAQAVRYSGFQRYLGSMLISVAWKSR
jgi:SAM-dependent methyltransferase